LKSIKNFLENNISRIAMVFGILGLSLQILTWFSIKIKYIGVLFLVNYRNPFSGASRYLSSLSSVKIIPILFSIMLIVGAIHYNKSKGKDSRLLKFGFGILFFVKLTALLLIIPRILSWQKLAERTSTTEEAPSLMFLFWPVLIWIPLLLVFYYCTTFLIKKTPLDLELSIRENGSKKYSFDVVSKTKRFTHFIFDHFLIYLLLWPVLQNFLRLLHQSMGPSMPRSLNNRFFFSLFIAIVITIYYLIFEGFFKATPIKFLTGTRILHSKMMDTPGFLTILGRTLSRRIPFEVLSFLGPEGWHDSASNTTLIAEKRDGLLRFNHMIWPLLFLLIYGSSIGYGIFQQNIEDKKEMEFNILNADYKNKSTIAHINKGDFLVFKPKNYKKGEYQSVVLIDNISDKKFTGTRYLINNYRDEFNRINYFRDSLISKWEKRDTISFDKQEILEAFNNRKLRTPFEFADNTYVLNNIEDLDNPIIKSRGHSSRTIDGISTKILNLNFDLVPIEIISIENLEGNVKWKTDLPVKPQFDQRRLKGSFKLSIENPNKEFFKSRMIVRYNDANHNYIITHSGGSIKINKEIME